jgi:hypothetical protein
VGLAAQQAEGPAEQEKHQHQEQDEQPQHGQRVAERDELRRPEAEQAGAQVADEHHQHDPQAIAHDARLALGVPVQDDVSHGQAEADGEQGVRPLVSHGREMLEQLKFKISRSNGPWPPLIRPRLPSAG